MAVSSNDKLESAVAQYGKPSNSIMLPPDTHFYARHLKISTLPLEWNGIKCAGAQLLPEVRRL